MPMLSRANALLAAIDLELLIRNATGAELTRIHLGRGVTLCPRGRVLVRGAPLALAEGGEGRGVLHEVGTGRVVLEL